MTLESLLRLAASFDLSLNELLDDLGQYPKVSVQDILRAGCKPAIAMEAAKGVVENMPGPVAKSAKKVSAKRSEQPA